VRIFASSLVVLTGFACALCLVGIAPAAARSPGAHRAHVRLSLRTPVIDLFHSASVRVSGMSGQRAEVRLLGANDRKGLAYEWSPYPWQRMRSRQGTLRGLLPAPPLPGIYELQLRLPGHRLLSRSSWLLRVFPSGTESRQTFARPAAVARDYVAHLPGDQVLVALRRWPMAAFDHRDRRLHRLFVIAYCPRGDNRPSARLGKFITAVREGFDGRWVLLEATTGPYD
jgi:hypothetical protein